MCNCISRRSFTGLVVSALVMPKLTFAQNTDAIRALNGSLDIDSFKAKKAARLSSKEEQTIFAVGEDAFLTDANFEAEVELDDNGVLNKLKVLSGQTLAVLKPRNSRQTALLMPNSTASIRGTGFYVNVNISSPNDYICCCYGHIEFGASSLGERQELKNSYHNATAINDKGDFIAPEFDYPYGHYDDELVLLEQAVGRKPHWELPDAKMHFLSPNPLPKLS